MKKHFRFRQFKNLLFKALVIILTLFILIPLLALLIYIIRQGISAVNWHFLTSLPKPVGEPGGGIFNAIIGTIMLIIIATVIAVPFGVIAGVYFAEHARTRTYKTAHIAVDVLQGTPSIVIGILVYLWFVKPVGRFSSLSGSIALAFMMLPSIIKSTEETLKLIPGTIKEAALSLGVPYYRTITRLIIPTGLSGILNGIILGVARVSGETAPLLFTAFGNPFLNFNVLKPVASLPLMIFNYATSPYEDWHKLAWGASFILITMILFLNILTKIAERKWKVQF